jgi:hypothetical protein
LVPFDAMSRCKKASRTVRHSAAFKGSINDTGKAQKASRANCDIGKGRESIALSGQHVA